METKVCSKCKLEKPREEYHKDRTNKKDGMCPQCKSCKRVVTQKRYQENREAILKKQYDKGAPAREETARKREAYREHLRTRTEKECPRCGELKPIDQYGKNGGKIDGRTSDCITCAAKYRDENKEKKAKHNARYLERNRERINAKSREHYRRPEVKEKVKEYSREYNSRPEVKAMRKETLREYYSRPEVKERIKEYVREYNKKNKEELRAKRQEYHSRPEVKERRKELGQKYRVTRKQEHIEAQRRSRDNITDGYIRSLMTNHYSPLEAEDVPQWMIDLKRAEIQLIRAVKTKTQETT